MIYFMSLVVVVCNCEIVLFWKEIDYIMDSSPILGSVLFTIFVIFDFIMYCFGEASQNVSDNELKNRAQDGDKRADKVLKINDNPRSFVVTIQFMATTFAVLSGAYNVFLYARLPLAGQIGAFAAHIGLLISLGIIVPQQIGSRKPEKWAMRLVDIVRVIMIILTQFTFIIALFSGILLKLIGIDYRGDYDNVTEEEIISIVNEGQEQGVLEEQEAEMISNIMEMDEKDAASIMTHRKNVVAINAEWTLAETVEFIMDEINSRFPVYDEELDNIIGIIHIRDVFTRHNKLENRDVKLKDIPDIMREPAFIPETKNIDSLFEEMQKDKNHMCIVIDEYGQMAGIVTLEDILEEIVGNIMDEYDEEDNNIIKESDDAYIIKGMTPLEDIEDVVGISFDEEDYDTLNGYLISKLDRIPEEDEKIELDTDKGNFQVLSVEGNMIAEVRFVVRKEEEE